MVTLLRRGASLCGAARAAAPTSTTGTVRSAGSRHGARGWDWFHKERERREVDETLGDVDRRRQRGAHSLHYAPLREGHVRPRAYFDVEEDGAPFGRMVFELANDVVPRTVENFRNFIEGAVVPGSDGEVSYVGTPLHRVAKDFLVQGGDVENGDGSGGFCSFPESRYFDDENTVLAHPERGVLSMANSGVHQNGSQFFVTLADQSHLDGRCVAFGRLVEGDDVLDAVANVFCVHQKPLKPLTIAACGLL